MGFDVMARVNAARKMGRDVMEREMTGLFRPHFFVLDPVASMHPGAAFRTAFVFTPCRSLAVHDGPNEQQGNGGGIQGYV